MDADGPQATCTPASAVPPPLPPPLPSAAGAVAASVSPWSLRLVSLKPRQSLTMSRKVVSTLHTGPMPASRSSSAWVMPAGTSPALALLARSVRPRTSASRACRKPGERGDGKADRMYRSGTRRLRGMDASCSWLKGCSSGAGGSMGRGGEEEVEEQGGGGWVGPRWPCSWPAIALRLCVRQEAPGGRRACATTTARRPPS